MRKDGDKIGEEGQREKTGESIDCLNLNNTILNISQFNELTILSS